MPRWSMQAALPDVFIANASMLRATFSCEIEDGIFDATREWLTNSNGVCFYLIFDGLHLVCGSVGTETVMLIKLLIIRLGLDDPKRHYKLRLLASSVSLPMDGAGGEQSRKYLQDLFAPFGTCRNFLDFGSDKPDFWRNCVIQGKPYILLEPEGKITVRPLTALMRVAPENQGNVIHDLRMAGALSQALSGVFLAMGAKAQNDIQGIKQAAEKATTLLTNTCIKEGGELPQAMPPGFITGKIFLKEGSNRLDELELALRGLMLMRMLSESGVAYERPANVTPAFRVHTFARNIESFFASMLSGEQEAKFADFYLERGLSHVPSIPDGERGRRLSEMLYCEACGDLLLGGQEG